MPAGLQITNGAIGLRDGARSFRVQIDDLSLEAGQAQALTGVSGSGKTLVLELLGLLRAPGRGTGYVRTDASGRKQDLAALWTGGARGGDLARTRGRIFGFVPQTGGLLPFLDVAGNIALPQRLAGCEDAAWCADLLARLGLEEVARLYPEALSIGQRQRAVIARALAHRPAFVLADEPTAALDPENADTVLRLLLNIAADQGCGVILSSHDVERTRRFGIGQITLSVRREAGGEIVSQVRAAPC